MRIPLPRFASLGLAALLALGCQKKEEQIAEEAEAALSAEEKMPAEEVRPTEDATAVSDPAVSGLPAELLASDQAYEVWFKKNRLDLTDPHMLDADADGDGASNRDEFMADTDPRNADSRPGVHKSMRLKEYQEVRVPLLLEGVDGETARIQHTGEGDSKTETVRAGQTIGGMKVRRVTTRRETDKNGDPIDLSRVELDDPATSEKVMLIKNLPAKSAASRAMLTSPDGATTISVKQGEVFAWPGEAGSYKAIDLRADQVVIQEVETKKMWTVPRQ